MPCARENLQKYFVQRVFLCSEKLIRFGQIFTNLLNWHNHRIEKKNQWLISFEKWNDESFEFFSLLSTSSRLTDAPFRVQKLLRNDYYFRVVALFLLETKAGLIKIPFAQFRWAFLFLIFVIATSNKSVRFFCVSDMRNWQVEKQNASNSCSNFLGIFGVPQ